MRNQFNEIMQKLRAQRVRARRYTAMLLVLAMLTSLSVSWRLHQVGTALTTDNEYSCGMEEHVHTDDCYTEELVCGYEEGEPEDPDSAFSVDSEPTTEEPEAEPEEPEPEETEPEVHHHTADCYETVLVEHKELTCGQEEHVHDETCPVDPDTGDFLCGFEEHTHTDDCFTTETETEEKLVCGYEEGQVLSDGAADDDGIAALEDTNTATSVAENSSSEAVSEPVLHHHTEACYEKVLTCTIPEHTHTLECLADYSADVETDDDWEKYSVGLSDNWNEALLAVAKEQLGYKESEKNFQTDEALGDIIDVHHYTRYGAFYGNPYADWDVAFIAFCQHYAGIPKTEIPQRLGLEALRADMDAMGFAYLTEGEDAAYEAIPGDVVTYNKNGTADDETIGIVETVGDDSLTVISGAVEGAVAEVTVPFTDVTSTILVDQAYDDYVGEADDRDADYDDEIALQPADEVGAVAVAASGETQYPINLDDDTVAKKLQAHFELQKKDSDDLYQPVTNGTTVNEGDDLRVVVSIKAPAGTFSKTATDGNKLTYTLPFKLKEPLVHQEIKDRSDNKTVIGYLDADTDGNVTVEFLNDVDTFNHENEFDADFKVWGKAVAKDTGENQTIKFPGDSGSFTLKKKSDISVDKTADTGIIREGDKVYFKYTVTVSSQEGTADENVTIKDVITQSGAIVGKYSEFELKKGDGSPVTIPTGYPQITKDSSNNNEKDFVIENLAPLDKGESYVLTYYYELTNANQLTGVNSVGNTASATYGNTTDTDVEWKTYTPEKISVTKTLPYDANTDRLQRIKWQIKITNPNNENLAGLKVVDQIRTQGSKMRMQEYIEIYDANNQRFAYVDPKDVVNENKDGFTYTFPKDKAATSSSYTITYYTSIPDNTEGTQTSVTNEVDIKKGDDTVINTDSETTPVGQRDWYLVKAVDREMSLSSDGTELLAKNWNFAVRTNASTETSKQFTAYDVLQTPTVADKNGTAKAFGLDHYAKYDDLKKSLESNDTRFDVVVKNNDGTTKWSRINLATFKSAPYNGTIAVTCYKDQNRTEIASFGDEVRAFKIDVSWTGEGFKVTQLKTASYNSYIKCTETGKTLDDLAGKDVVTASNECAVDALHKASASTSYTKPEPEKPKDSELRKLVSKDVNVFADKTVTIETGTPNGTVIWFKLLIKHPNPNADKVTITDTLPKGLKYMDFTADTPGAEKWNWQDSYRVGTTEYDRSGIAESDLWASTSNPSTDVFKLESSTNGNGQQVLTFTLSGLDGKDLKNVDASIIYGVIVEDDYWKDISANPSKDYPNEAKWGKLKKSATATVTRTNFETKKDVAYDQTTQTATYTITINEQSKQLLPYEGGYLELEDILTVPKGLSATLDQNSIVVKDGNDAVVTSDALKDCEIDPDTHTMKIKIKDGKKYLLSYTYKFVPDENLASGEERTVQNEVKMFGKIASNKETHFQNAGGSGTASNGVTDILTLVKSEKGKNNNTLGGVTFELSEYGKGGWTSPKTYTTASDGVAKGTITFRYNANKNPAEGTVDVKADTLYRLVETKTVDNYILDNTPHYFVMLSQGATADEVYPNFSGSGAAKNDIKFVSAGQTTDVLKVENEARKIKVEKVWKDADGNAMAAPQSSITVTLQRKVGDAVDNDFSEKLTLTQGNGWKVTYPDTGSLPETDKSGHTYYYFVTEDSNSVPNGYNVMYSYVDKNGATQSEHGVTAGGTATITNQKKTNWLNVTKVWQDSDRKPLTENLPDKITLVLYEKGTPNVEKVRVEVTPDADGNWKHTFTGLEPEKEYYVEEVSVGGYEVVSGTGENNAALPGATITVTNRKNAPGYELPATGSTGTAPYTTAGAVLMGAALVGGYRRKRRQERRGE